MQILPVDIIERAAVGLGISVVPVLVIPLPARYPVGPTHALSGGWHER